MKVTLCTLFEGHYHHGVAALANSLVASGYAGTLWVGHRGPLPAWMREHPGFDGDSVLQATPALALRTIALDPPVSLNYCKASLIEEVLQRREPDADACAYVDPDIVVTCSWPEMAAWFASDGLALVEDADGVLPSAALRRQQWAGFFSPYGQVPVRTLERYYNSGFVGVQRAQLPFVRTWQRTCDLVAEACGRVKQQRKAGEPGSLFHSTDEDALNFALMSSDVPIDAQGPEAMGFAPNGRHLSHAVGALKPWQGRHLRRILLRGESPDDANRWFYRFAAGPLAPFSPRLLLWRRLSLALACLPGRIAGMLRRSPTRTTTSAAFSVALRSAVAPRIR
ncbi:MAG: hypothetical protein ABWZ88_15490 [Variovorax sp.]